MSNYRTCLIDRVTAEQLLCGTPARAPRLLADLLAAAAAPARAGELAGEEAALAVFRNARLATAAEPRRQSMLAKLLTVKVAALTIGLTGLSGVALAASTGTLPTQLDGKGPNAHATPSHSQSATDGAGARKSPKPTPSEKGKKDHDAKGTPSPSMVGLCHAYGDHPADKRGKALESPAFTALITAAGGTQNVAAYCKVVLAAKASETPKPHTSGKPSDQPSPKHATGTSNKPSATPAPRLTAS